MRGVLCSVVYCAWRAMQCGVVWCVVRGDSHVALCVVVALCACVMCKK